MPELPEVETTRRGIETAVTGRRIRQLIVRDRRLRWPIATNLEIVLAGQQIRSVGRRAKYLLIHCERGALILHLGMSGSLRLLESAVPTIKHDHFDLLLDSGQSLRFNDPRRFGSLHWTDGDLKQHKLLQSVGPEPLGDDFDGRYIHQASRGRRVALKNFLMNGHVVVGVGNIYASESLYRAKIRPGRRASSLSRKESDRLARAVKSVLASAIRVGGTTLRDYVGADGKPGYFRQKLYVYERDRLPCRVCRAPIRKITQGQRSTYYCPSCQK
ncbi:MAG TPA: bifunctional DNA-formamidopyrimidine glycosylase/DNA-(apurinic or apyrimidinic site) lyase [Steroidobacteraceae bacterium]|nr:bifunctional DNA-formamidopyrimidine glycosylase/DNA-(apurinic or apyrimidinic site) lyase [Steroidobacteraceae bacterium]